MGLFTSILLFAQCKGRFGGGKQRGKHLVSMLTHILVLLPVSLSQVLPLSVASSPPHLL